MAKLFLPTNQFGKRKNPLIQERNPNEPRPFQVSWFLLVIRICCLLVCGCYLFSWLLTIEKGKKNIYNQLITCEYFSLVMGGFMFWEQVRKEKLAVDQFPYFFTIGIFSIVFRAVLVVVVFCVGASWGRSILIYSAAATTGLIIDSVFIIMSHEYYGKLYDRQREKLTEELQEFLDDMEDVKDVTKKAQLGYFTEMEVPRRQISELVDISGNVVVGVVLLKGECVYYCDAQEYINRANEMNTLQTKVLTLQTEQRVLKGEDVEEEEDTKRVPKQNEAKGCTITIDGSTVDGSGEFEPLEGYFSCVNQDKKYVKLEDYRAICRQVVAMKERLESMRAENRVLRDAIKEQRKKEQAVVELKDEKIIDDVD